MARAKLVKFDCLRSTQGKRHFFIVCLPAKVVTEISYVATRGKTDEEGAVQRLLNPIRIAGIRDFALAGGDFPNAMVLNWVSASNKLNSAGGALSFNVEEHSAQVIDGQHRIAGIAAAIEQKPELGKLQLPIVIYEGLSTRECADIFLSINTEQKPVPKSLVFDLYGVASEELVDQAALRARDIAMFLNESEDSPYFGQIKGPNDRRRGGIALSTAVSAIKPLVDDKGVFEQIEIGELEMQKKVILNLFRAISFKYSEQWHEKTNVFMYAAGFSAAMRFLQLKLIPHCNLLEDFTEKAMSRAMNFGGSGPISQDSLKGVGGVDAINKVYDSLVATFEKKVSKKGKIAI